MSAPLEVLCVDSCGAYADDDVVFEFFLDPLNPWTPYQVTKAELATTMFMPQPAQPEHAAQWRWRVYVTDGVADVCYEGCEDSAVPRYCVTKAVVTMPGNQNIADDTMKPLE